MGYPRPVQGASRAKSQGGAGGLEAELLRDPAPDREEAAPFDAGNPGKIATPAPPVVTLSAEAKEEAVQEAASDLASQLLQELNVEIQKRIDSKEFQRDLSKMPLKELMRQSQALLLALRRSGGVTVKLPSPHMASPERSMLNAESSMGKTSKERAHAWGSAKKQLEIEGRA